MNDQLTINELLQQYILEKPLSEASIKSYRCVVKQFQQNTSIFEIDAINFEQLVEWRLDVIKRASDITWNTYLRHMRALFNFAIHKKMATTNLFKELHFGKYKSKKVKTVTQKQLKDIIVYLNSDECSLTPGWFWVMLIRLKYFTAIRRKQLVTITWKDVDFEQLLINLSAQGEKTDIDRYVPISKTLAKDLKDFKKQFYQLKRSVQSNGVHHANDQIFNITAINPKYTGDRMTEEQLSGFFRRLSKKMGFMISPHRLRHTIATEIAKTGQIKVLQDLLGHTDIRTTMNFYVHPDIDHMREVITDKMEI